MKDHQNSDSSRRSVSYCAYCGLKLDRGLKYCPGCGKVVPKEVSMQFSEAIEKAAQFSEKALPQIEAHLSKDSARFFSPIIYIFAFLCLLFPFVSIAGISMSGFNMTFGMDIGWGVRVGGHWASVLLFLVILAGIGLSFWQNENRTKVIVALSAFGLLLLLGLAIGINSYLSSELGIFRSYVNVRMGAGFYLLFLSFLAAGAINIYFIKKDAIKFT